MEDELLSVQSGRRRACGFDEHLHRRLANELRVVELADGSSLSDELHVCLCKSIKVLVNKN